MPTLLVVDDSAVERRLIGGLLGQEPDYVVQTAENPRDALRMIAQSPPDMVITDLEMPDISGLQLVKQIRIHHTGIPVILITAHGSEEIAVEALREGAASYVPKAMLSESLVGAVRQVLAIVAADRKSHDLMSCVRETELKFELRNDPALIDPLVSLVQRNLAGLHRYDETVRLQLGVALEQALLNALYRGNLELTSEHLEAAREAQLLGNDTNLIDQRLAQSPYCDRRIFVDIDLSPQTARFVVRDDGPGFDVASLAPPPTEALAADRTGRGIVLMRSLMDEVIYNEQGNEVTMVKRGSNGT